MSKKYVIKQRYDDLLEIDLIKPLPFFLKEGLWDINGLSDVSFPYKLRIYIHVSRCFDISEVKSEIGKYLEQA